MLRLVPAMKKLLLSISFLFLCIVSTSAQSIQVGYIEMMTNNILARRTPRTDKSGKNCAVLKIAAPGIMNLSFTGDVVGPIRYDAGIYYVYIPEGTKSIGFQHKQLGSGIIDFSSAGIDIITDSVYSIILAAGSEDTEWQLIVFRVEAENTSLYLDGKPLEILDGIAQKLVPAGLQHHYMASAPGMETKEGDVPTSSNTKIEITLNLAPSLFVDLGLSVKWASFNLGAAAPEDFGDYYSWGETATKPEYFPSTYIGYSGDVASAILGEAAHIPSKDEWQELIDNCSWTWKEVNGIHGYSVKSNVPGYENISIFIPAAPGSSDLIKAEDPHEYNKRFEIIGRYWSSTPAALPRATALNIRSNLVHFTTPPRSNGLPIRPVSR